jgi:hypothetical protein
VEIITKMQKCGGIIEKSSIEQLNSGLHEIFLTWCKFKLVQIMVPGVWERYNRGNYFYV